MVILPKAIYTIPIKIPMTFCTETDKSILKNVWKHKRPQIAKAILSKRSDAGCITIPNFKLYYRAIKMKAAWHWHKNRQQDQRIRREVPDISTRIYSQLIFDRIAHNTQWRKTASSTNIAGKTGYSHVQN
jgi:hypothetical protein